MISLHHFFVADVLRGSLRASIINGEGEGGMVDVSVSVIRRGAKRPPALRLRVRGYEWDKAEQGFKYTTLYEETLDPITCRPPEAP